MGFNKLTDWLIYWLPDWLLQDKYPKAKYHFLVLPVERIQNLKGLQPHHVSLLEKMSETGRSLADQHPGNQFR